MAKSQARASRASNAVPTMREAVGYLIRIARMMRPYWPLISKGTALSICIAVMGLIPPYIAKLYFDRVYPLQDVSVLHVLVGGSFGLTIATAFMNGIKTYYGTSVSEQLQRSMSLMFFNHLQHLPVRFFDEHRVGEITSRFANVASSVGTVTRMFETVMLNGMFLVVVPPLLLYINPTLALISLISFPLTTTITTLSSHRVRRLSQQGMEAAADLSAFQVETLTQIRSLKGMAAEPFVFAQAQERLYRTMDASLKSRVLNVVVSFANGILRAAGAAVFAYVGWTQILQQRMTLGDFTAFGMYVGYLTGPVGTFASLFSEFQTSSVGFSRMFEYLDASPEQDPEGAFQTHRPISFRLRGEIRFTNVSFAYAPDRNAVCDLSFVIAAQSLNAIVGPTGAGKSSILRLICGMERSQSGEIVFDGTPIGHVSLPDLRRQIAAVWQDTSLVRGTIRENLTFGLENVPQHRLDEAIELAQLTEVVGALPHGLDTTVAEGGATLSAGQRQRLTIARALLRDAPILLLDEATANIDALTESELLRRLFLRTRGRTVLFVTHRVGTAALADNILVVAGGRLVGSGTHKQLLDESETYRALCLAAGQPTDNPQQLRLVAGGNLLARP